MEAIGLYWIPLKLDMLPFVDKEVDKVIQKFFELQEKSQHGNKEAYKEYELLKISIKARIENYDEFYKQNFSDPRIAFFEKQKFRLRKLIHECRRPATQDEPEKTNNNTELDMIFVDPVKNTKNQFMSTRTQNLPKTPNKKTKEIVSHQKIIGTSKLKKNGALNGTGRKKVKAQVIRKNQLKQSQARSIKILSQTYSKINSLISIFLFQLIFLNSTSFFYIFS